MAIRNIKKRDQQNLTMKSTQFQEQKYRKDFYNFSKSAIKGLIGKPQGSATFDKNCADKHYKQTYSSSKPIDISKLDWIPKVDPTAFSHTFNNSPIVPGMVKKTLAKTNKGSSPGPDGIRYGILFNLPSVHHILASLFSKVLALGTPPTSWGKSKITLIHKKGPLDDPTNFRMISLTSVIGKCFHLILSNRFTDFLLSNGIINSEVQKAFLPGISGCFEHNIVLQEAIKNARVSKKTLHLTFFDLADAFGSVPHDLIIYTIKQHGLPANIESYMTKMLNNSSASVCTGSWVSDTFQFKRGVFQGDPLSPIIFNWVFNPIITSITSNPRLGYTLGEHSVATLPFADDFTLLTKHKGTHQSQINTINSRIESLGMQLKPSKCRSFSISAGKPSKINFFIGDKIIPSISDEDQHYLGAKVYFQGKESEVLEDMTNLISKKLKNLDDTLVRNEYKLAVHARYLIPSLRFILTVHDLTPTSLRKLDTLCDKFAKKWAGVPRSGTNVLIHSSKTLNIPSISQLYNQSHALCHTSTRLKGDQIVNDVLDLKISREREWLRKSSAACTSEELYKSAISSFPPEDQTGRKPGLEVVKKKIKSAMADETSKDQLAHTKKLISQGRLLELLQTMDQDATWKSYLYNLPKGTLKFILNSTICTLPTKSNLVLWGRSKSDKCVSCGRRETTNHVLSSCPVALEQGRYTYRHNKVLQAITSQLDQNRFRFYSDIQGQTIGGGTIPPDILVTSEKPDIVIIDPLVKVVTIIELTCPWEERLKEAREHKTNKYAPLINDIQEQGHAVIFIPLEIGVRGIINQENKTSIEDIAHYTVMSSPKALGKSLSRESVIASYYIFLNRNEREWNSIE